MAKIITFGEIMLRLAPNGYYRFFQNDQIQGLHTPHKWCRMPLENKFLHLYALCSTEENQL